MSNQVRVGNDIVTLLSTVGGWSEVKFDDGTVKKVRNGKITGADGQKMKTAKGSKKARGTPKKAAGGVSEGRKNGVVKASYLENYEVVKIQDGNRTKRIVDNGDKAAKRMRNLDLSDLYKEASEVSGIPQTQLREKYGDLNPGLQRMSLGNRIRAGEKRA